MNEPLTRLGQEQTIDEAWAEIEKGLDRPHPVDRHHYLGLGAGTQPALVAYDRTMVQELALLASDPGRRTIQNALSLDLKVKAEDVAQLDGALATLAAILRLNGWMPPIEEKA